MGQPSIYHATVALSFQIEICNLDRTKFSVLATSLYKKFIFTKNWVTRSCRPSDDIQLWERHPGAISRLGVAGCSWQARETKILISKRECCSRPQAEALKGRCSSADKQTKSTHFKMSAFQHTLQSFWVHQIFQGLCAPPEIFGGLCSTPITPDTEGPTTLKGKSEIE